MAVFNREPLMITQCTKQKASKCDKFPETLTDLFSIYEKWEKTAISYVLLSVLMENNSRGFELMQLAITIILK